MNKERKLVTRETAVRKFCKEKGLVVPVEREEFLKVYFKEDKELLDELDSVLNNVERLEEDFKEEESMLEKVLEYVKNNEFYNTFVNLTTKELDDLYPTPKLVANRKELYKDDNVGSYFVSVDLVSANYLVLKELGVFTEDNYTEMLKRFTKNYEKLGKDKQTRQVLFGKLNNKKLTYYQKYLTANLHNELTTEKGLVLDLEVFNRDELVYKFNTEEEAKQFKNSFTEDKGKYHLEMFYLNRVNQYGYVKEYLDEDTEPTFHKVSKNLYREMLKVYNEEPFEKEDFYFLNQDRELCYRVETRNNDGDRLKTEDLVGKVLRNEYK